MSFTRCLRRLLWPPWPSPPVVGREAIILCAVPSGFFGILFGLRYGVVSQDAGSIFIASTVLSAATLPAAILLTAGTH